MSIPVFLSVWIFWHGYYYGHCMDTSTQDNTFLTNGKILLRKKSNLSILKTRKRPRCIFRRMIGDLLSIRMTYIYSVLSTQLRTRLGRSNSIKRWTALLGAGKRFARAVGNATLDSRQVRNFGTVEHDCAGKVLQDDRPSDQPWGDRVARRRGACSGPQGSSWSQPFQVQLVCHFAFPLC